MPDIIWIVICIALIIVCFAAGILYRKRVAEREIGSAEEEAKRKAAEAEANLKYEIVPIQKLIRIQLESGLRVASKIRD